MISEFATREQLDFMIFANPVPVSGNLIPAGGVEEILRDNPATMFIVDEADTVSPSTQAAHLATKYENVVFLGSLSKLYGLSGLRIGYLITPKPYVEAFRNTISAVEVSSLAIIAGNTVIEDDTYLHQTQRNVVESIRILEEACKGTSYRIAATPHCFACYIYSETRNPKDDLGEYGIKILQGQYFGLPEGVNGGRFNLSDPANSKLAADKIRLIHGHSP
jgi:histidinol-phosphate/aromatic aminotransferase/cobyric acid decarboxylase-like protein